jgi:hypothetical protein
MRRAFMVAALLVTASIARAQTPGDAGVRFVPQAYASIPGGVSFVPHAYVSIAGGVEFVGEAYSLARLAGGTSLAPTIFSAIVR